MFGAPRDPKDLGEGCRFRDRCPAVISPEDISIDQEAYREVMAFREKLERDDLSIDRIEEAIEEDDPDTEQFATAIRSEYFTHGLDGENEAVIEESLEALAGGDRQTAIEQLRERFESVCETVDPVLGEGSHPAACHLFEPSRNGQQ